MGPAACTHCQQRPADETKRHCASPTCTWWVCPNNECRYINDTHGHSIPPLGPAKGA